MFLTGALYRFPKGALLVYYTVCTKAEDHTLDAKSAGTKLVSRHGGERRFREGDRNIPFVGDAGGEDRGAYVENRGGEDKGAHVEDGREGEENAILKMREEETGKLMSRMRERGIGVPTRRMIGGDGRLRVQEEGGEGTGPPTPGIRENTRVPTSRIRKGGMKVSMCGKRKEKTGVFVPSLVQSLMGNVAAEEKGSGQPA